MTTGIRTVTIAACVTVEDGYANYALGCPEHDLHVDGSLSVAAFQNAQAMGFVVGDIVDGFAAYGCEHFREIRASLPGILNTSSIDSRYFICPIPTPPEVVSFRSEDE